MHALIRIVRQTDAIGIASDETLRPYLQRGELQPLQWRNLPQNLDSLSARCGIISRSGYRLSAAAKAMIETLVELDQAQHARPAAARFPLLEFRQPQRAAQLLAHRGKVGGHRRIGQQARHQRRGAVCPPSRSLGKCTPASTGSACSSARAKRIVMLRHQHAQQRGLVAVHGVAAGIDSPPAAAAPASPSVSLRRDAGGRSASSPASAPRPGFPGRG